MDWIDIHGALPDAERYVLFWDCHNGGFPNLLFVESYDVAILSGEDYSPIYDGFTHWMYAPDRPKE